MNIAQKQTNNAKGSKAETSQSSCQNQLAQVTNNSKDALAQRDFISSINNSPRMLVQRQRIERYRGMNSVDSHYPHRTPQRQQFYGIFGKATQLKGGPDKKELLQGKFTSEEAHAQLKQPVQNSNNTGLPDKLKSGIESLSGISMDNVKVHYNSSRPAQLNALAYAQGSNIHLAPGQEQHLPHEAWHLVQQAQGRVRPTMQMKNGVPVNDDKGLEREADMMGAKAVQMKGGMCNAIPKLGTNLKAVKSRGVGTEESNLDLADQNPLFACTDSKSSAHDVVQRNIDENKFRELLKKQRGREVGMTLEDIEAEEDPIEKLLGNVGLRAIDEAQTAGTNLHLREALTERRAQITGRSLTDLPSSMTSKKAFLAETIEHRQKLGSDGWKTLEFAAKGSQRATTDAQVIGQKLRLQKELANRRFMLAGRPNADIMKPTQDVLSKFVRQHIDKIKTAELIKKSKKQARKADLHVKPVLTKAEEKAKRESSVSDWETALTLKKTNAKTVVATELAKLESLGLLECLKWNVPTLKSAYSKLKEAIYVGDEPGATTALTDVTKAFTVVSKTLKDNTPEAAILARHKVRLTQIDQLKNQISTPRDEVNATPVYGQTLQDTMKSINELYDKINNFEKEFLEGQTENNGEIEKKEINFDGEIKKIRTDIEHFWQNVKRAADIRKRLREGAAEFRTNPHATIPKLYAGTMDDAKEVYQEKKTILAQLINDKNWFTDKTGAMFVFHAWSRSAALGLHPAGESNIHLHIGAAQKKT